MPVNPDLATALNTRKRHSAIASLAQTAAVGATNPIAAAVSSGVAAPGAVGQVAAPAASAVGDLHQLVQLVPPSFRPFIPDVLRASQQYDVPASVLLAQLDQESKFGTDPATFSGSSAGAQGVSQFIPGTAQLYGVDTSNTPAGIRSQIDGQAKYMRDLIDQTGSVPAALTAYSGGYGQGDYADPIMQAAQRYAVADKLVPTAAPGGGSPYVYPFGPDITIGRTDMGIDPYGTGPIRTIGRAKYLGEGGQGWPTAGGSGTGPVYKLLQGPLAGTKVYTYEGITPAALTPGEILHKGQVIAESTGSSFETGFAAGAHPGSTPATQGLSPFQPLAASHYTEGQPTPEGQSFADLISRLAQGGPVTGFPGGPMSPAAARQGAYVSAATGATPAAAQTAYQSAREQNQPAPPSMVTLTPPATTNVPFPHALASIFGGTLPEMASGGASGPASGMPTSQLAILLASLGSQPTSPLAALRRRRYPY